MRRAGLLLAMGAVAVAVPLASASPRPVAPAVAEPIEGDWWAGKAGSGIFHVRATGPATFEGLLVELGTSSCFKRGEVVWQITGSGTSYTGTTLWRNASSCGVAGWGASTWTVEGTRLRWTAAHPTNTSDVRVNVLQRYGGTPQRPVLDAGLPQQPDEDPLAGTQSLAVSVDKSGTVTAEPARGAASAGDAEARIQCGVAGFACFDRLAKGTPVTLTARAAPGFEFTGWTKGCSGSEPSCTVVLSNDLEVSASFGPKRGVATVAAALARPQFRVGWRASIGSGRLVVRGRVSKPAQLQLELRRPAGAPLVLRRFSVRGGAFTSVTRLDRRSLLRGALLLPGGFVVVLRGRSGTLPVPLQLKTVVLPSPPEGVVRRAYASASQTGRSSSRLRARTKEAWAHFLFETQPRSTVKPTVSWFNPSGKLVGTVKKANRPDVLSYARADAGLANGLWRVELRAGKRLIKRLSIRVGTPPRRR